LNAQVGVRPDGPIALTTAHRGRVLLLQAAFHRDPVMAASAWDRLVRDAGSAQGVMDWARRGPEQRLLPALGTRKEMLELPLEVSRVCRDATVEAWGLNERLLLAVRPAIEALAAAGIPVVALKGVAVLGDIYPEHRLRPIGDVDVLVPRRLALDALQILRTAGWDGPPTYRPFWLAGRHAVNLGTAIRGPSIDLHWRASRSVPHRAGRQPWPADDLEALPVGHPLEGSGLLRPVSERLLVQIASHGMQPDNPTLSHWIADLDRILAARPGLDGERVAGIAAEDGLHLEVHAALETCRAVLGTEVPSTLLSLGSTTRRADKDARMRWVAAARARDLEHERGVVTAIRRFILYGRQQTHRRHWFARLQVASAVMSTRLRVHRVAR